MYNEFMESGKLVDLVPPTGQKIINGFVPEFIENVPEFKTDVLNWTADYVRTKLEVKETNITSLIARISAKIGECRIALRMGENPDSVTIKVGKQEINAIKLKEELTATLTEKVAEKHELSNVITKISEVLGDWTRESLKTDSTIIRLYAECIGIKGAYVGRDIKSLANTANAVNKYNLYSARHAFVSPKDGEYKAVKNALVSFLSRFTNESGDKKNMKKVFPNMNGDEITWLCNHVFDAQTVRFIVSKETGKVSITALNTTQWERELAMIVLYKLNGHKFGTVRNLPA